MTYEEARKLIDEMRAEIKAKHMCRSMGGECTSEEVAEYRCRFAALSMAVEALEKQTSCKDCAGCTHWLCECANVRAEVCDRIIEQLKEEIADNNAVWKETEDDRILNCNAALNYAIAVVKGVQNE